MFSFVLTLVLLLSSTIFFWYTITQAQTSVHTKIIQINRILINKAIIMCYGILFYRFLLSHLRAIWRSLVSGKTRLV